MESLHRCYKICSKLSTPEPKQRYILYFINKLLNFVNNFNCVILASMNAIENIHNLEYLSNSIVVLEKLKEWQKARPDNKDLDNLITKYLDITFYIIRLQQDAMAKDMMISKFRFERNKARLELQELKDQYENLKQLEL